VVLRRKLRTPDLFVPSHGIPGGRLHLRPLRNQTGLHKRIKYHRRITRALGTLIPFRLSMTLRFSNRAFGDSELYDGSTFEEFACGFRPVPL